MDKKVEEKACIAFKGRFKLVVRDKDGNIKKQWNCNSIGNFLLGMFRKICPKPYDGEVRKSGILPYLAVFGLRVPFMLGSWRTSLESPNMITDAGLALLASRINGAGAEAAATYLALGIGTTDADELDTALESEIVDTGLERAAATCTRQETTVANDTARLDKTWTATGIKAITEIGALNAASTGDLLGHQVFAALTTADGDSVQMIYDFICARAA